MPPRRLITFLTLAALLPGCAAPQPAPASPVGSTPAPTPTANATVRPLEQFVAVRLMYSPDEVKRKDCWQYGGHGGGEMIAAYNVNLLVTLTALLAEPETRSLPLEDVERAFARGTATYLKLYRGGPDVFLAEITGLYCPIPHGGPGRTIYVVDRSGDTWQIGHARRARPSARCRAIPALSAR